MTNSQQTLICIGASIALFQLVLVHAQYGDFGAHDGLGMEDWGSPHHMEYNGGPRADTYHQANTAWLSRHGADHGHHGMLGHRGPSLHQHPFFDGVAAGGAQQGAALDTTNVDMAAHREGANLASAPTGPNGFRVVEIPTEGGHDVYGHDSNQDDVEAHQVYDDAGNHWLNEAQARNKLKKLGKQKSKIATSASMTATVTATDSHSDKYNHHIDNEHSEEVEKAQMSQLDGARGHEHVNTEEEAMQNLIVSSSDDDSS